MGLRRGLRGGVGVAGEVRDLSTGSAQEPSSRGGTTCEEGCV